MKLPIGTKEFIERGDQIFLPHLSLDCVIFGYEESQLKVLLTEIVSGKWMLPGGYIKQEESIGAAAHRVLKERSGLEGLFLRQFHTFGSENRSFESEIALISKVLGHALEQQPVPWFARRFVSIGYYALVRTNEVQPADGIFAGPYAWHSVKSLPEMVLDHAHIASTAFEFLQAAVQANDAAHFLLPEKFTMPDLHRLHEVVLDKKLDRSRFQKKMLSLEIYERLPDLKEGVAHKRPYLYRFK